MAPFRVLSVCTHNRTRSVLIGALLTREFEAADVPGAVRAAGFGEPGLPPTQQTVSHLAGLGIDVHDHVSRRISAADVETADVIVTAERAHVVEIAGRWPGSFDKTMTLPELVSLAHVTPVPGAVDVASWLQELAPARPGHVAYLDADIGEIADPTGQPPAAWRATIAEIDRLTRELARHLARLVPGSSLP